MIIRRKTRLSIRENAFSNSMISRGLAKHSGGGNFSYRFHRKTTFDIKHHRLTNLLNNYPREFAGWANTEQSNGYRWLNVAATNKSDLRVKSWYRLRAVHRTGS
jgi:hypothetical protein